MSGNLLRQLGIAGRLCMLGSVLLFAAGCGTILAGPGETITIPPIAGEDLSSGCVFDINMPDDPLGTTSQANNPNTPSYVEAGALVIYERGDSSTLFNDTQVQNMAAELHLVTVFAHQCDSKVTGDIQSDATKGPGRALFAALTQYASDTQHAEIATNKVVLFGFSAAGVLSFTMEQAYPGRVLTAIPYASGSAYFDMDNIAVSQAMAQIPTLVLANAYDSESGDQRSLRIFQRAAAQGGVWNLGVQNHTDHCCTLSTRDLVIPWVTALTPATTVVTSPVSAVRAVTYPSFTIPSPPNVSFLTYTDGWPDDQGELDFWIPTAAMSPSGGGPTQGWVPNAATADAWYKWVTSPGTN